MEEISPLSDSYSVIGEQIQDNKLRQKVLSRGLSVEVPDLSPLSLTSKNMSTVVSNCTASPIEGLIERADSAIKAVSTQNTPDIQIRIDPTSPLGQEISSQAVPERSNGGVLLPSLAGPAPERMMVIPAGGLGKAAGKRNSPRKHQRTPSGAISIDMVTRTPSTPARELDRLHVENRAPPRFICPISGRIMRDPVILGTGTTCDRGALERYLAKGHKRCPVTKRPLKKPINLMPNIELKQNITAWAKRNAPWILDKDGYLQTNDPAPSELQGSDPQYVTPISDAGDAPGASGAGRGASANQRSRIESGKSSWKYTDGSKVRPGARNIDINAYAGTNPWQSHRGISSVPRSQRRHRSSSRSTSPSKRFRGGGKFDWISTAFLGAVGAASLVLFIMSLMKNSWKFEPISINPMMGASAGSLAAVGGQALPLMDGPGKQWWRLLSSPFLPAGIIDLLISLFGLFLFGRYAQTSLPCPQASIPAVYLTSALVGALASANLNAYYLSCGALAGVCGLLATVCADQALNFKNRKLFNFKEWYLVAFMLLLVLGGLITASLLPMICVWYCATSFFAGFLVSYALILLPRVGRGKPGNVKWACAQIFCALVVVITFTAAVVGAAMPTKLGENDMLKEISCIELGNVECVPFGFLSNGCGVTLPNNGTTTGATLTCPTLNATIPVPPEAEYQYGSTASTEALCTQYCTPAAVPPTGPAQIVIAPLGTGAATVIDVAATDAPAPVSSTPAPAGALPVVTAPTPIGSTTGVATAPSTTQPLLIPSTATTIPATTTPTTTPQQQPSVATGAAALPGAVLTNGAGRKLRAGQR